MPCNVGTLSNPGANDDTAAMNCSGVSPLPSKSNRKRKGEPACHIMSARLRQTPPTGGRPAATGVS